MSWTQWAIAGALAIPAVALAVWGYLLKQEMSAQNEHDKKLK